MNFPRPLPIRSVILSLFIMSLLSARAAEPSNLIFIGTYTKTTSRGIYAVHLDAKTGALDTPVLAAETANPGFLALGPQGNRLYAIEDITAPDKTGGGVRAYALDAAASKLTFLNDQPSGGGSLTHLVVDATARMLVAVSYGDGYVVSFPVESDGSLGSHRSFIRHQGPLGPNASRQDKPHAHSVTLSPDNRFAFVCDLGLDRVMSYRLNPTAATLAPNDPPFIAIKPGAGPRHSKFSADGRFYYVLDEIDGSITACAYDAAHGAGTTIQHISTLPVGFVVKDEDRAAEIRIHPNGAFVYASNRGDDSIAVFARDPIKGTLSLIEIVPSGGKAPRNFALSPDGTWLVCAHQDSDTLAAFHVDPVNGRLTRIPGTVSVPQPICVLFAN
jgi:6-phosphogluconolactonase